MTCEIILFYPIANINGKGGHGTVSLFLYCQYSPISSTEMGN